MIFSFLWSNFILKVTLSIMSHSVLWGYMFICSLQYDYFKSPQWTNSWSCLYHTWTAHSLKLIKECFIWNTESSKSQFSWAGCSHITASLCNSESRVILVQCPNFTPLKKSPDSHRLEGETVHSQYRQDFTTEAPHVGNVDEMFKEEKESVNEVNPKLEELLVNSNRKWMLWPCACFLPLTW